MSLFCTIHVATTTTPSISIVTSSSIQISTQSLDLNTRTKWSNRTTNDSLPLLSPPRSSYFWSATGWAECNNICGGGQQVYFQKN